jgi:exopolysaccharide production protein ExoZ
MGDASYSIYLTHILTLGVLRTAWKRLGLVEQDLGSACVFLAASIAVSILVGIAVYYVVEVPLMRLSRRVRSGGRAGTPIAAGAAGG